MIASYNNATGIMNQFKLNNFGEDDHNDPAIGILSNGNVIVFYGGHNHDNNTYYRISTTRGDITTLGTEHVWTSPTGLSSYNQLMISGNTVIDFYRIATPGSSGQYWGCKISTNNGTTWGNEVLVFNFGQLQQGYIRSSMRWNSNTPSMADIILSLNPSMTGDNGIYYTSIDVANKLVKAPNGTVLMDLTNPGSPLDFQSLTKVYDYYANGNIKAWTWDVYAPNSNYITVLYATFPSSTDHRYYYARYNSTTNAFDSTLVVADAGGYIGDTSQISYSGGMSFAKPGYDTFYASVQINGLWQIEKYTSPNNGTSWTNTQITNDANKNIRPIAPVNMDRTVNFLSGQA
jgi:hypothetical protein